MGISASTKVPHEVSDYEQPLNERMRRFMRLEFLYKQSMYNSDIESTWATRAVIANLLEIMAILTRGDVRSEVHKELDLQIDNLKRFQSEPEVDSGRLGNIVDNLVANREEIDAVGTGFIQPLKDCEFLSSIKHRSTIPGGTCEFDLPEFSHWLRQSFDRRQRDVSEWLEIIRPICDAVTKVLWVIRESAEPTEQTAVNGMYQHRMRRNNSRRLLRVTLPSGNKFYPEISGSRHRFTIRFLDWSTIDSRAVQTDHDVKFNLSIC